MKLHTRELTGTTLLIAYYMADGCKFQMGAPEAELALGVSRDSCLTGPWLIYPNGRGTCLSCNHLERPNLEDLMFPHKVSIEYPRDGIWVASIWMAGNGYVTAWAEGPHTAALRCYIVVKLGEELEIADAILEALK